MTWVVANGYLILSALTVVIFVGLEVLYFRRTLKEAHVKEINEMGGKHTT